MNDVLFPSIPVVYRSPEYDILAYEMALDRLVEVGYPAVSDSIFGFIQPIDMLK